MEQESKQESTSKALSWLWLTIAIITEVLGSSYLKIAQSTEFGFLITAPFICVSYYFIALTIKRISVSVAYAMWEVLGVVCIVLIGVWYFGEQLLAVQYAGIVCAIVGILCINFGELDSQQPHKQPSRASVAVLALGLMGLIALAFLGYCYDPSLLGLLLVCIAGVLDVVANLALKASQGFSKLGYGIGAVAIVVGAFYLLMLALDSMELAVAYSSWGAIGIIGTIAGGGILFGERLTRLGYVGVVLVIVAVGLLHELIRF